MPVSSDVLVVPGDVVGDGHVARAVDLEGGAVPAVVIGDGPVAPDPVARREDGARGAQEHDADGTRVVAAVHRPGRVADHVHVVVDVVVEDGGALARAVDLDAHLVVVDVVAPDGDGGRAVAVDAEAVVLVDGVVHDVDARGAVLGADARSRCSRRPGARDLQPLDDGCRGRRSP